MTRAIARGVTAMVVGSGALLGRFSSREEPCSEAGDEQRKVNCDEAPLGWSRMANRLDLERRLEPSPKWNQQECGDRCNGQGRDTDAERNKNVIQHGAHARGTFFA